MSLFPNESYSFPDLTEGANKKRVKKEQLPPEDAAEADALAETGPEELVTSQPEAQAETPIVPPASMPQQAQPIRAVRPAPTARPISASQRPQQARQAVPVMPIIPVVPDQLVDPPADFVPDELAEPAMEQEDLEPDPIEIVDTDSIEPEEEFQAEEIEDRVETRRPGRGKVLRFIVFETLTIAVLLASAKMAVMQRYSENSLSTLYGTVVVFAAIAATIIPVVFFALPPRLPTDKQ